VFDQRFSWYDHVSIIWIETCNIVSLFYDQSLVI